MRFRACDYRLVELIATPIWQVYMFELEEAEDIELNK